jgi:DNA-binding FrmR family transcriptional regulator
MVSSMKDTQGKKSTLSRLSRIEGQVRGVSRMIDEDRYCIDVLTQIRAIQAALGKVEQEILRQHLNHCVAHAFDSGNDDEKLRMVDEIIDVLEHRNR